MLVLNFHAFPDAMPGGFIGVDVFFVISGFLITGIITRELELGRFSLVEFYNRRIRRIFPALIVVLCSDIGAGLVLDAATGLCAARQRQFRQRGVSGQYRAVAAVRLFRRRIRQKAVAASVVARH